MAMAMKQMKKMVMEYKNKTSVFLGEIKWHKMKSSPIKMK